MKLRTRKQRSDFFKRTGEEIRLGLTIDQAKARRQRQAQKAMMSKMFNKKKVEEMSIHKELKIQPKRDSKGRFKSNSNSK